MGCTDVSLYKSTHYGNITVSWTRFKCKELRTDIALYDDPFISWIYLDVSKHPRLVQFWSIMLQVETRTQIPYSETDIFEKTSRYIDCVRPDGFRSFKNIFGFPTPNSYIIFEESRFNWLASSLEGACGQHWLSADENFSQLPG